MSTKVEVVYSGVSIEYREDMNAWFYELRGRERHSESLAKAKEVIDRPEPREKVPFTRVKAYLIKYSDEVEEVEITSLADSSNRYGRQAEYWAVTKLGRKKVNGSELYFYNAENGKKIAQRKELMRQSEAIDQKRRDILATMDKFSLALPVEEVTA